VHAIHVGRRQRQWMVYRGGFAFVGLAVSQDDIQQTDNDDEQNDNHDAANYKDDLLHFGLVLWWNYTLVGCARCGGRGGRRR